MDEDQELELAKAKAAARIRLEKERSISAPEGPLGMVDAALSGALESVPVLGSYYPEMRAKLTGETPEAIAEYQNINPGSSALGNTLGVAASMMAPLPTVALRGGAIAKAASRMGLTPENAARLLRIVEGGATGALMGGLSKADSAEERLMNAGLGWLISAGPTAVLEGGQAALGGRKAAERLAFKSMGPTASQYAEQADDAGRAIGATLLDEGILGQYLPRSKTAMLPKLKGAKGARGKEIGGLIQALDNKVEGQPVISRLDTAVRTYGKIAPNPVSKDFERDTRSILAATGRMSKGGDLTPAQAQQLKKDLQNKINFENKLVTKPLARQIDQAEQQALSSQLDELMAAKMPENSVANTIDGRTSYSGPYPEAKNAYSNLDDAIPALEGAIGRERAGALRGGAYGLGAYLATKGVAGVLDEERGNKVSEYALPLAMLAAGGSQYMKYDPQFRALLLNAQKNPQNTAATANSIWQIMKANEQRSE